MPTEWDEVYPGIGHGAILAGLYGRHPSVARLTMLFLLFLYSLAGSALPVSAINFELPDTPCKDIDNCRTLWEIIWSCLTTIFLCTWVVLHPNIPEPSNTRGMSWIRKRGHKIYRFMREKMSLFLCSLLIPEYILAWSIRQRLMVSKILNENRDLDLTPTHGFFMLMGGFYYFQTSNGTKSAPRVVFFQLSEPLLRSCEDLELIQRMQTEATPIHPLTHKDVTKMVRNKEYNLPTKSEISDRSKSDWFAKTLVMIQTLWFLTQWIARHVEHLPTTRLEVVTVAYTIVNLGIFIAWWDKPYNVDHPIRVFQKPEEPDDAQDMPWPGKLFSVIIGGQDTWTNLHQEKKVPTFYAGKSTGQEILVANCITLAVGVAFGAIHCTAWSYEFGSPTEAFLWRLSSAIMTGTPIFLLLAFWKLVSAANKAGISEDLIRLFLVIAVPLSGVLYAAARFTSLLIAVMNLSSLTPGAFADIQWTTFIPHF